MLQHVLRRVLPRLWQHPHLEHFPRYPCGLNRVFRRFNAGCYFGVNDTITELVDGEDRCQRVGMACSVYPFETASEGDVNVRRGGPVCRCVDIGEDAREYLPCSFAASVFP